MTAILSKFCKKSQKQPAIHIHNMKCHNYLVIINLKNLKLKTYLLQYKINLYSLTLRESNPIVYIPLKIVAHANTVIKTAELKLFM